MNEMRMSPSASDQISEEEVSNPPDLELRAKPEPVKRVNKRNLFFAIQIVIIFLSVIIMISLSLHYKTYGPIQPELYGPTQKQEPEGLAGLPASYDQMQHKEFASREKKTAFRRAGQKPEMRDFSGDEALEADAQIKRASRARLARMAEQAREAGVLFRLQGKAASERGQVIGAEAGTGLERSSASQSSLLARMMPDLPSAGQNSYENQNATETRTSSHQVQKLSFLQGKPENSIYNTHQLQVPKSPYQLLAGTIIPASLITGLNSDLPGQVIAQVSEHVYDSVTGQHLLIPQGARLIGKYDSVVAFGQERALVIWQRLIFPDGSSIVIDNLPAVDLAGYAGLEGEVDPHTWKLIKGIALSTLLGIGTELSFGETESDLLKALRTSAQGSLNQAGQSLTERNLNIQPTLKVHPGWRFRIIVTKDLVLRPIQQEALK